MSATGNETLVLCHGHIFLDIEVTEVGGTKYRPFGLMVYSQYKYIDLNSKNFNLLVLDTVQGGHSRVAKTDKLIQPHLNVSTG